jgi:hypothetical protein
VDLGGPAAAVELQPNCDGIDGIGQIATQRVLPDDSGRQHQLDVRACLPPRQRRARPVGQRQTDDTDSLPVHLDDRHDHHPT